MGQYRRPSRGVDESADERAERIRRDYSPGMAAVLLKDSDTGASTDDKRPAPTQSERAELRRRDAEHAAPYIAEQEAADARAERRAERRQAGAATVSKATGSKPVSDGAGFIIGLIGYALVSAFLREGPAGPRRWLAAKFLNRTRSDRGDPVGWPGRPKTTGGTASGVQGVTGAAGGYVGASRISGGPQPGTQALQRTLLGQFPGLRDLGIYNPRDVCGNAWPNIRCALSLHAEGRAGDLGVQSVEGGHPLGHQVANYLVASAAALGIQEVIFADRRWSSDTGRWLPYRGRSRHLDHVHFAQTPAAAARSSR